MELDRMPPGLERILSGEGFRRRRRLVLPFCTTDLQGYPRIALLTFSEIRAVSPTHFAVSVAAGSRTAANLTRRRRATLLYLQRGLAASLQARAGRGRASDANPDRHLFPLSVYRVRLDQPSGREGDVSLLSGPMFAGKDSRGLFSEEVFEELGRAFRWP